MGAASPEFLTELLVNQSDIKAMGNRARHLGHQGGSAGADRLSLRVISWFQLGLEMGRAQSLAIGRADFVKHIVLQ